MFEKGEGNKVREVNTVQSVEEYDVEVLQNAIKTMEAKIAKYKAIIAEGKNLGIEIAEV